MEGDRVQRPLQVDLNALGEHHPDLGHGLVDELLERRPLALHEEPLAQEQGDGLAFSESHGRQFKRLGIPVAPAGAVVLDGRAE